MGWKTRCWGAKHTKGMRMARVTGLINTSRKQRLLRTTPCTAQRGTASALQDGAKQAVTEVGRGQSSITERHKGRQHNGLRFPQDSHTWGALKLFVQL